MNKIEQQKDEKEKDTQESIEETSGSLSDILAKLQEAESKNKDIGTG